jgi:hypothetical protein
MERGVHKLAFVSKLLLDKEVIHLRQENERLRLQLFWRDHDVRRLNEMMASANQSENGPQCTCNVCAVSGRMDEDEFEQNMGCLFKPWFESCLERFGLVAKNEPASDGKFHECGGWNRVYDVDSHFHHIGRSDWFLWTYGARLWKAKTADDPELAKLRALFKMLSSIDGED